MLLCGFIWMPVWSSSLSSAQGYSFILNRSSYSALSPCLVAPLVRTLFWSVPPRLNSWHWNQPRCRHECLRGVRQWTATRFHQHSLHLVWKKSKYKSYYLPFTDHTTLSDRRAFVALQVFLFSPIANSSMPAFRRLSAGGMTSSWDFPSVMRIPILGNPSREPDSGLKQFSKMKFKASPREMQGGEKNACKRKEGRWWCRGTKIFRK